MEKMVFYYIGDVMRVALEGRRLLHGSVPVAIYDGVRLTILIDEAKPKVILLYLEKMKEAFEKNQDIFDEKIVVVCGTETETLIPSVIYAELLVEGLI